MVKINENKFNEKTRRLISKVNDMSPEEFNEFMIKLENDIRELENAIKSNNAKIATLDEKPKSIILNDIHKKVLSLGSVITCVTACLAIQNSINPQDYVGFFYSVITGTVLGDLFGYGVQSIGERKLISNKLNEMRIKHLKKKLDRLNNKEAEVKYVCECINQAHND